MTLEFEAEITALRANVEEKVTGCRDGRVLGALDYRERAKLFRSREVVGEFIPNGTADADSTAKFGFGISKSNIVHQTRNAG